MNAGHLIALTNPAMSLIFSAAFFLLWRHRRQHRYIAVLSASFLAIGAAFALQYLTIYNVPVSKLGSNLLFLAGGVGFAVGGLGRFERRLPLASTAFFAAIGFGAFAWFLFVDPDITRRIYAISFAFGAIALVMATEIGKVRDRKLIDNVQIGLLVFFALNFFIRPVVVVWIDGPYENSETFHQSLYWITLAFSATLFLPLFALSLITAIVLDAMDELRQESQTDPLSGLLNRRGFEEGAAQALQTARRRHMPAALVVCDLDHFKTVNDTWGHGCGDAVIAAFAECLRGCTGPGHIVGRVGGEEFAILLQGANAGTGRLFAEGARAAFAVVAVPGLPEEARFTASFGVAEWRSGEGVTELFARADAALYEAKKAGRDCVRVTTGPLETVRPRRESPASRAESLAGSGVR